MSDHDSIDLGARKFFDDLWARGDPWELESADSEARRYAALLRMLGGRRYGRVLEVGCGAGTFTRQLARLADRVVALDIAVTAIERARVTPIEGATVEFRTANVMEFDVAADGPWDCVIISETIYFLGWRYTFFDVAWLAARLLAATSEGGRLLLANSEAGPDEPLMRPWLIRTYRDLFANVGFCLEAEERVHLEKHGIPFEFLLSLFRRPPGADGRA